MKQPNSILKRHTPPTTPGLASVAPAAAVRSALVTLALFALVAGCGSPPDDGGDDPARRDGGSAGDAGTPDAPSTSAGLDLIVEPARARIDLSIEHADFAIEACELQPGEVCVGGPGRRRLLRFSMETPNIGGADLHLGHPTSDPKFEWSQCHSHYHYPGYASYELLDQDGKVAAVGHKQAFCLVDTRRYLEGDPTVPLQGRHTCQNQGIQRGWSDIYASDLPCQYVDITGVPDGPYTLRMSVNQNGDFEEMNRDNNTVEVPVTIGAAELQTPLEDCPAAEVATKSPFLQTENRECGWEFTRSISCTPDSYLRVGCSAACNGPGSCTGDPMMRVCDSDVADGNCSFASAMARNNNSCGSTCPRSKTIICPDSGSLDVFTAARVPGEPYSCDVQSEIIF